MAKGRGKKLNLCSEAKEISRRLKKEGWEFEQGQAHVKAYPPNGGPYVVMSATPGRGRWRQNLEAELRRAFKAGEGVAA